MSRRSLNGAQYSVEFLKKAGLRYFFGIPGHGNGSIFDAVKDASPDVRMITTKHEQWAGHMADGYFRANRRIPAAVTTSVGPGATNLATPLATAFVDSSAFIALTGQIQTYLFGMGIFQEIERKHWADYSGAMSHLTKRTWLVTKTDQLPKVLPAAVKTAISGRPGPVLLDLPMDVQVDQVKAPVPKASAFTQWGRPGPDQKSVQAASRLLLSAKRPLILVGGGVTMSGATEELIGVAEFLGCPAVTTFRGDAKGGFPGDHELNAFHTGNIGSMVGNELSKGADVILAVGTTFSDETTSSYARDFAFNIPPTKLIQIDVDPHEIGKNYPIEVGMVADAKTALADILAELRRSRHRPGAQTAKWSKLFHDLKSEWEAELKALRTSVPMGIPNIVEMMRGIVPRDGIVCLSAGLPQEIFSQQWLSYRPMTFISSGGFSTMGFAFPAAIGAKLARPKQKVIAVEGDGSFMMNNVELSTAVENKIPVMVVVLNNFGFVSIRDMQMRLFKRRLIGTEFKPPDFGKLVTSYGASYALAEDPVTFKRHLKEALKSEGPFVLEARVERKFPNSGTKAYGYWDIPSPYVEWNKENL